MKRTLLLAGVVLALLFAALTLNRSASRQEGETDGESSLEEAEKERIRRFWTLHREATRRRTEGAYEEAIRLYEAALELDPRHEDALYYVSNMYLEAGRLDEAERALNRLTRLHPTSSRGLSRLGDVYLCFDDPKHFDPERAQVAYRKALTINQEETGPLLRLAQVAVVLEDLSEARRLLGDILGTNSRSIESYLLAGYVAWKRGDVPTASRLYEQALSLARGDTPKEHVIGEGDRRTGAPINPGEQLSCPTMLELLQVVDMERIEGAIPRPMPAAYRDFDKVLSRLRWGLEP